MSSIRDWQMIHEQVRKQAERALDELCEQLRAEFVVPYCDRRGYRFTAGLGSWSFDRPNGPPERRQIGGWNDELLPKTLREVLRMDYFTDNNDLGSMMEDYTPPNWKGA
jgi:hypothetical protein